MSTFLTSEAASRGHTDKVCGQISGAFPRSIVAENPLARVAFEADVCTDKVHIMGEISSSFSPDYEAVTRRILALQAGRSQRAPMAGPRGTAAELSPGRPQRKWTARGLKRRFDLCRPIYCRLSRCGHFGANAADMLWEKTGLSAEPQSRFTG